MEQWVKAVSNLIHRHPETKIGDGQLAGCTAFLLGGREVHLAVVASSEPHVPRVAGFSKLRKNPFGETELSGVQYAFILSPALCGTLIQALRVLKVDGNMAIFEAVGRRDWFLPDPNPRN